MSTPGTSSPRSTSATIASPSIRPMPGRGRQGEHRQSRGADRFAAGADRAGGGAGRTGPGPAQFSQEEFARAQDLRREGRRHRAAPAADPLRSSGTAGQYRAAKTAVTAAQVGIKTLQAQLEGAAAQLEQSQAQLDQAKLNLAIYRVVAAQSGRVTKLAAAKGAYAQRGPEPDDVRARRGLGTANFKETQLADMRPGQRVDIRIDAYPGRHVARPCREHPERQRRRLQPAAGGERDRQLRQGGAARAGEDRVRQRRPMCLLGPGMSVVPDVKVR